jgi:hypothetical protein
MRQGTASQTAEKILFAVILSEARRKCPWAGSGQWNSRNIQRQFFLDPNGWRNRVTGLVGVVRPR